MTRVIEFPWVSCHHEAMTRGNDIGDRIRAARQLRGWSREELAEALGGDPPVTTRTIDNWENGRTYPRDRTGTLEHVLGIELRYSGTVTEVVEDMVITIPVRGRLTEEQRAAVAETARVVAEAAAKAFQSGQSDTDR
jgi:transcriptional regulator with XRE-family HTH domain